MSIPGGFIAASEDFMKANSYINKNGEHPKLSTIIYWNKLVLNKEELTDDNWLYIGNETEENKKGQLSSMKFHKGVVPIFE